VRRTWALPHADALTRTRIAVMRWTVVRILLPPSISTFGTATALRRIVTSVDDATALRKFATVSRRWIEAPDAGSDAGNVI